jgi:MYXO-CTERM domain-containing protein
MTIVTVRSLGTRVFLPATLGGAVLLGCVSGDGDDVVYPVDDDVENYTVDDDSLDFSGTQRAVLKTDDAPPIAASIYTDAILAIAIAEEGNGPNEVGVSTGYPLMDYADDVTGGWCSEFASWAFWRGGCPFSGNWGNYDWMLGGSTQIRQWFIDNSRFVAQTDPEWATYEPQPGDYIRYNTSGGGHSGIVRYVEGTTLYTVEGNVNNIVMLRSLRNYKTDYSDPVDGIDGFGVNPCGDEGAGGAAGSAGAGNQPGTGGAAGDTSTGGAVGTGGEPGAGGAVIGSGGEPGAGGAVIGSGGEPGTGGVVIGSGGEPGTGGAGLGSGGTGVGGSLPGTGGAGVGGSSPGAGGTPIGSGGTATGSGGAGVGGSLPGTGGAGVGGSAPGVGGAVGLGGAATGGSTAGPLTAVGGQSGITAPGGAPGEASNEDESEKSGCSCTVPGASRRGGSKTPWSALALLGLLFLRRRRNA